MDQQVMLCHKCVNLDLNKLAQKIHAEVVKVDNCEEELYIESGYDNVIFGCPALYHASNYSGMYDIVDLRLMEKFKKSEDVAADLINSSLITALPQTKAVVTGNTVIYWGNNLDVISELLDNPDLDLTIITDRNTVKELYPFNTRIMEVDNLEEDNRNYRRIEITGSVGDFNVVVDGYDPVKGNRGSFSLKAGQLIVPQWLERDKEGLYSYANTSEEFEAALKATNNLGGYTRISPVRVHHEMCAASKSGYNGCELCLSCPQGAISKDGNISISASCNGCGFCAAVCPISVIDNTLLPSKKLWEKIDAVLKKNKILAFICERALGSLYGLKDKKLPQISPVVVPCINAVSEVHYLYAVLKGANVAVIPCEDEHNFECFDLAKQTLNAFGFDCLKKTSFEELKNTQLKDKNPGDILDRLPDEKKREQWLYMVHKLMDNYKIMQPVIDSKVFAAIEITDNCTLCMTCTQFCPTEAIRNTGESINFNHGLCIACGLCTACPEDSIKITRGLDLHQLGDKEIFKGEVICCPSCGKPHIPKNLYEKFSKLGEHSLLFCSECRPKIILESIYEEMTDEQKGSDKNE
ncbi:MAG: 4Fe-4S binding protein [Archaeoglobaceae archaeon]